MSTKKGRNTMSNTETTTTTTTDRTNPAASWKGRYLSALSKTREDNVKLKSHVDAIEAWVKTLPDEYGSAPKRVEVEEGDTVRVAAGDMRRMLDAVGVKDGIGKVTKSSPGWVTLTVKAKAGEMSVNVRKEDCTVTERAPATTTAA
jgi:hypothetical protein